MEENNAKVKILFLCSDPIDEARLRLGEEYRGIEEELSKAKLREQFELIAKFSVRTTDFLHSILESNPQILHFSGHGSEKGNLCLENEIGESQEISIDAISSLFKLVKEDVKCVLLNACFSEGQAKEIAKHIDYVIGMSSDINDYTAQNFAIGFYSAIGVGKDIESAFKFALVRLKLMDLVDQNVPVLLKKSVQLDIPEQENEFVEKLIEAKKYYHEYLKNDQINETGAWGISQIEIMEAASGRTLSENDRKEGGIISTYLALRGLLKLEKSPTDFRLQPYAHKALGYFLRRQTNKGSFGRYVFSRSGLEIHPSIRHTALSVSALIDLGGPPGATFKGINYINNNWKIEDVLDDASPSLAIASIIHTIDKFIASPHYLSQFNEEEKKKLNLSEWSNVNVGLLTELTNLSRQSELKPFWRPYGGNKPLVYETALTTIDLLSFPLPQELRKVVSDIIASIANRITKSGGIPYNLETNEGDLGMTIYYYSLTQRPDIRKIIFDDTLIHKLDSIKPNMEEFILSNIKKEDEHMYSHCDTIASIFFIE